MASLRASAQSIAAYRSSSSQPVTPSSCPSELVAVWVRSPRAVASLESGPITWATSIAVTRSRLREGLASMSSAIPTRCALPSTAATCPWGRLRVISNASHRSIAGGRPFSARLRVCTLCSGQCDRLARVRVFTLPCSR